LSLLVHQKKETTIGEEQGERSNNMGFPPLHLGFEGEGVKQPMEIEGCGFAATLAHPHERGRKRPPSPRTPPGDDHTSSEDDEGDWLVSDSEEDDHENKGATP
jgi:hypothetical protein